MMHWKRSGSNSCQASGRAALPCVGFGMVGQASMRAAAERGRVLASCGSCRLRLRVRGRDGRLGGDRPRRGQPSREHRLKPNFKDPRKGNREREADQGVLKLVLVWNRAQNDRVEDVERVGKGSEEGERAEDRIEATQ